ncbi:CBS domain-containing protein [Clostridium botulinum]|uniref:N-acetylmuramoyl-L-alanine amidase family protein n=1 Tax=Clostridium botulinum TaxID=1491 RepID=A0A6B4JHC4_CLOBO|nr:CBS domain-containing protein [Clostridium botulinum]EES48922.1 cell wall binding repeat protein [Clostridium botulinum E1 str. 'BoNT E Beluga']MBY6759505.1 CBS domain-containing protein [Clostridium botulinum]MBY6918413.1 CBS domain-containing protein [Clostridium botulinum]MCR1129496.1 CBS domain-containing protein [Clostridium botulinum]NFJ56232.1 N-acetylmuramoyl-L-alanine amidase family protein [Clostridium botulinum]
MIKRIKKIMALVLVATSVVAIAPREVFKGNVTAYAATTKEGTPSTEEIVDMMLVKMIPSDEKIIGKLQSDLKSKYENASAVNVEPKPIKTLKIPVNNGMLAKISAPIAEKMAAQILQMGGITPENPKYNEILKLKTEEVIKVLTPKLKEKLENVPVYKYEAITADNTTIVGKGFVVGGIVEVALMKADKDPIYLDSDKLDNSIIKQLIDKVQNEIKGIIDNISSTITGALDDVADSVDKISNSITDLFDDLDESTDDFFDKINKDEGWDKHDGYVYYYDEDGIKYRGVHEIKGKNYYFNRVDGAMETGWQIVDGKRCYFSPKKGYQLYSQWIKDGDKIYCLDEKGEVRKSQWAQDGANSCYLKADGTVAKGWYSVNRDERYYFNETTGYTETSKWIYDDQEWYYLKDSGVAATDWECINGKWYCFKSTGKMYSGWFRNEGNWYYSDSTGAMQTGWVCHKNKWFYLDDSGKMKKSEWLSVDGNWYYFNLNGEMITSSRYIDGTKYNFNSDGSLQ